MCVIDRFGIFIVIMYFLNVKLIYMYLLLILFKIKLMMWYLVYWG